MEYRIKKLGGDVLIQFSDRFRGFSSSSFCYVCFRAFNWLEFRNFYLHRIGERLHTRNGQGNA